MTDFATKEGFGIANGPDIHEISNSFRTAFERHAVAAPIGFTVDSFSTENGSVSYESTSTAVIKVVVTSLGYINSNGEILEIHGNVSEEVKLPVTGFKIGLMNDDGSLAATEDYDGILHKNDTVALVYDVGRHIGELLYVAARSNGDVLEFASRASDYPEFAESTVPAVPFICR